MRLSDFSFELPQELIATHPAQRRDGSRLLVLPRKGGLIEHSHFDEILRFLRPGDCLVINNTRVIPARLAAWRANGGEAELLLIEPLGSGVWEAYARPGRKLKAGTRLRLPGNGNFAEILDEGGARTRRVRLELSAGLDDTLEAHGRLPLPPYILRRRRETGEEEDSAEDRERYQTVYARPGGSVAAPTAGLHFTPELLEAARGMGVEVREITLHVGPGTFEPVEADAQGGLSGHRMHRERYAISEEAAAGIDAARRDAARRVIAVGTTTTRALEACFLEHGEITSGEAATDIFIRPGFSFGVIDGLITNFHLPESTLLMLVSALAGRDWVLEAYAEAVREKYRFFSYGDAMLII